MKKQLVKNKVYAIVLLLLGMISVFVVKDIIFLIFCLAVGILMFFSKESWVM